MPFRIAPWGKVEVIEFFILVVALSAFSVFYQMWFLLFIWVGLFGFVCYFFRDPERYVPEDPDLIVSPADGKVSSVEEVDEPSFIGGRATRISIFLNVFNVHVNRTPVQGRVSMLKYKVGEFHNAGSLEKCALNEANFMGLTMPNGMKVGVKQIAGLIARRIICAVPQGAELAKGERYGMIKFGSRTDIFLPVGAANVEVSPGDIVEGGSSIIGRFLHSDTISSQDNTDEESK